MEKNVNVHEENLINLFEGKKVKINWEYLMKNFDASKIPESFKNHFNKELTKTV